MSFRYVLLLLFLLSSHMALKAQLVYGIVTDSLSGEPLDGVMVMFRDRGYATILTNENGHYVVPKTKGRLLFGRKGYVAQGFTIRNSQRLDVKLVPSSDTSRIVIPDSIELFRHPFVEGVEKTAKILVENHLPTKFPDQSRSKFDIGPLTSIISYNTIEGVKLRAGGCTTANLHPHIFLNGYVGHGFGDHRWKGMGELQYSLRSRKYGPHEFPRNNIGAQFLYDIMAPTDMYRTIDKDNVFAAWKWTRQDHMSYLQRFRLRYEREWERGYQIVLSARRERYEAAGKLFFQPLSNGPLTDDAHAHLNYLHTTDLSAEFAFNPGVKWENHKHYRVQTTPYAPLFSVKHTTGIQGLIGGDFTYNLSEALVEKRFGLGVWGDAQVYVKAQYQWNRVPFPLLCYPVTNLSYLAEDRSFYLIKNMEFITDRNATVMLSCDLKGRLFGLVPILKKWHFSEFIGCNMFFGSLSSKNNPWKEANSNSSELFYFPGYFSADKDFVNCTRLMHFSHPYVEVVAGIHNMFKMFNIEYVHRLNYLEPGTQRWGIRVSFRSSL